MNAAIPLASTAPAQPRFVKIGEDGSRLAPDAAVWGAVLDTKTNLMWDAQTRHAENFQTAQTVPLTLGVAGFTDWRMPTVQELFLLADHTRVCPAINTDFFPDTPNDWFWSSNAYAASPSACAWGVNFALGYSGWGDRGNGGFVRAVRPGECRPSLAKERAP